MVLAAYCAALLIQPVLVADVRSLETPVGSPPARKRTTTKLVQSAKTGPLHAAPELSTPRPIHWPSDVDAEAPAISNAIGIADGVKANPDPAKARQWPEAETTAADTPSGDKSSVPAWPEKWS